MSCDKEIVKSNVLPYIEEPAEHISVKYRCWSGCQICGEVENKDISCIIANELKFYISDEVTAKCQNIRNELKINRILSVGCSAGQLYLDDSDYLFLQIDDIHTEKITDLFNITNAFLDEGFKLGKNIIINCGAGWSRSCAVAIGYLIYKGFSFEDALQIIKQYRPVCAPNYGFIKQLREYH